MEVPRGAGLGMLVSALIEEWDMKDVFVSFNRADRSWADWIAWILDEAGYQIVYQPWDFRPGANFVLEMHKAASETLKTVIVLSDNYLKAEYTNPEWAVAFAEDPRGEKRKLIPIRVSDCHPTGLLKPLIHADLVGSTQDEAKIAVLNAVSNDLRIKPSEAPIFPGVQSGVLNYPGVPVLSEGPKASSSGRVLTIWMEKLEFLREHEALANDAAQKFTLRKQIEEALRRIQDLRG